MAQQVVPEARRDSRSSRAVVTDDCEPLDGCCELNLGSVLGRVSIVVKRCHTPETSYKGKHLIEVLAYSSEVQSVIIMAGNMVACRQTQCWLRLDQKAGSEL